MNIKELQDRIIELKKEKNVCILGHAYQGQEILEVADYVGDSFGLSKEAQNCKQDKIIMCGVRFMAETVKVLSPNKRVILANPYSSCPMAEQVSKEDVVRLKRENPKACIVAYINTSAELKTLCDLVVTSSSAKNILNNLKEDHIIFIPDPNLGSWLKKGIPGKNFRFFGKGCPVHMEGTLEDLSQVKYNHPQALFLAHPEMKAELAEKADYVGSTTGIISFAENSPNKEFIIGTENSIVSQLQYRCPGKVFYPLSKKINCPDMRIVSLLDVYKALKDEGGEEIILDDETIRLARISIDRMIDLNY